MSTIKMLVQKTEDGKRVELGTVNTYVPVLAEIGIAVEPVKVDENGEAEYADNTHQFIYAALLAAAKAQVRNKLVPGTINLRPGQKLPENLEELVTPTVSNKGAVLAERRALMDMFKAFLPSTNKPEAVQTALFKLFNAPDNIILQPVDKREKLQVYFNTFGESVGEKLTDWQIAYVQNVIEQCAAEELDF